jgi:hypothetical protein
MKSCGSEFIYALWVLVPQRGIRPAYVGANSFAQGDLSRPHICCSSKFRKVISHLIL